MSAPEAPCLAAPPGPRFGRDALLRRVTRFLRGQRGNSTVEFALLFPAFMAIFASTFESGLLITRYAMLDRGLDLAVRELRLNTGAGVTHEDVRARICENTLILPNCEKALHLELVNIPRSGWTMPDARTQCVDRTGEINPTLRFAPGDANDLMFIRACYVVDPIFPTFGLGSSVNRDASGAMRIVATSAFSNEPL